MKSVRGELLYYKNQFQWWLEYEGLHMGLLRSVTKVASLLGQDLSSHRWFPQNMERRFDQIMGIETATLAQEENLDLDPVRKGQSSCYEPTSAPQFRHVMSELNIAISDFTFVDFGAGKGKALLLAYELGFKKIIGVELSKSLHQIALENISKIPQLAELSNRPVCLYQDAAIFEIPDEQAVLYFFNPFNDEVMRAVVSRIEFSLAENFRQVFVVYNAPKHRCVFDESAYFRLADSKFNDRWLVFESTPPICN